MDSSWGNKGSVLLQQWKIEPWDDAGTLNYLFWQMKQLSSFMCRGSFLECLILISLHNPSIIPVLYPHCNQWAPHTLAMPLIHTLVLFLETGRCFRDHTDLLRAEQDLSSSSQEPPDYSGGRWIPNPAVQAHQGGWPAECPAADQSQVRGGICLWRFAQTLGVVLYKLE